MKHTAQILLVDDDVVLLQALPQALYLRIDGVGVDTCDSALEALKQIQEHEYDAIVSDIKMPGMDGLTLLAKIQELQPETPTLLITGHGTDLWLRLRLMRDLQDVPLTSTFCVTICRNDSQDKGSMTKAFCLSPVKRRRATYLSLPNRLASSPASFYLVPQKTLLVPF